MHCTSGALVVKEEVAHLVTLEIITAKIVGEKKHSVYASALQYKFFYRASSLSYCDTHRNKLRNKDANYNQNTQMKIA